METIDRLKSLSKTLLIDNALKFDIAEGEGDPYLFRLIGREQEIHIESNDDRFDVWLRSMSPTTAAARCGAIPKVVGEYKIAGAVMSETFVAAVLETFIKHYADLKDRVHLLDMANEPVPEKKPLAVENFENAVKEAVDGCNEHTGEVSKEVVEIVQSFYAVLTDDQKEAARDFIHDGIQKSMNVMDVVKARAYLILKDNVGTVEYGVGIDLERDPDDDDAKFIKISDPDEHQLVAIYSPRPDPKPIAGIDLFTDHIDLGHWLFDEWIVIASLDHDGRRRTV